MSTAAQVNERLAKLTSAGVSVWLDQIRRSLVEGGELARMVEEESLRGVTANPSIFEKAILGSDDYKEDLEEFARQGLEPQEIYDRLAQRDVQLACDVLAGVHEQSGGRDGFVSLEVAPEIAHDTERTLDMARVYWKAVDRPNLMIKIPGTPAGCAGDRAGHLRGDQRQRHAAVRRGGLRARGRGLPPRAGAPPEEGLSLDINSVASFFVSRVDTKVDKQLEELGRADLAGTAALANARAAYRRFKEIFSGGAGRPCATPAPRCSDRCGPPPGPRTPPTPTPSTSMGWWAPHRQHDADGHAARLSPTIWRSAAPQPRSTPSQTWRRWPRPGSTWSRSPTSCWMRASSSSRTP